MPQVVPEEQVIVVDAEINLGTCQILRATAARSPEFLIAKLLE